MKKIVGIGFFIPTEEDDDYIRFDSQSSLSDFDIAIFYPSFSRTNYTRDYPATHAGKDLYDHKSSIQISENALHWANEIKSMLDNGKNVYVILCPRKDFYIHTGEKQYSGTGRSQKVTNVVVSSRT